MSKSFVDAWINVPPKSVDASKGERSMQTRRMRLEIVAIIIGFGVTVGGAFIQKWTAIPSGWTPVAEVRAVGIGTALMVAGILATLVDRPLKQEIVRDAFRSVMGWVAPEQLRGELEGDLRENSCITELFKGETDLFNGETELFNGQLNYL